MPDSLPPVVALLIGNSDEAVKSLLTYKSALQDTQAATEDAAEKTAAADAEQTASHDALADASEASATRQVAAAEKSSGGATKALSDVKKAEDDAESDTGGFSSRVASMFKSLGSTMGSWGIPFGESVSKMGESIDEAETSGGGFVESLQQIGKASAVVGAVGIAAVAGESIHLAESYQQSTAQLASSAGISVQAATGIGKAFTDTAFKTVFSAQQQMQAYSAVAAQLGTVEGHALSTKEAVSEMTQAGDLAEASNTSLASATSSLAAVQQAYGLSARQASSATNVLYNVSRLTAQSVPTVASAVDKLHTQLGVLTPSLGDVGGLLTDLASHGETGRQAISAVNSAFTTLLGGSKTVTKAASDLGLQIIDTKGEFVGMDSVIGQLQPVFAGMTQAQQLAAATSLFGASSAKKLVDVIDAGSGVYEKDSAAVAKSNSAHAAAEAQSKTLHHEIETLVSGLEDEGVKLGSWLIPKLQVLVGVLSTVVNWLMRHKVVMEIVAGVIGTVLVVAIGAWIAGMVAAAAATVAATAPILAIVAAVALVAGGLYYAYTHFKTFRDIVNDVARVLKEVLVEAFKIAEATIKFLMSAVMNVWHVFQDFIEFFSDSFQGKWGKAWDALKDIPKRVLNTVIDFVKDFGPLAAQALEALGGLLLKGLMLGINAGIHLLWEFFVGLPKAIITLVGDGLSVLLKWGGDLLTGLYNGVLAYAGLVWDFWTKLPPKVVSLIGNALSWLYQKGKDLLNGLLNGILNIAGSVWDFFNTTLPNKISGLLSGAASWLFNTGRNIVQGLINGIENMAGSVDSAVKGLVNNIPVVGGVLSHIPGLATGGRVTKPTLAWVGEDEPETVIPDSVLAKITGRSNVTALPTAVPAAVASSAGGAGGVLNQTINLSMDINGQNFATATIRDIRTALLQLQRNVGPLGLTMKLP